MSEKKAMFIPVYKDTHSERLARIRALSPKEYLDDGPMALFYAVSALHVKKFSVAVEACLLELEKLYNLPPFEKKSEPTLI